VPFRVLAAAAALTIGYYRLLTPAWPAALATMVWYATPAFVVAVFTQPGRVVADVRVGRWAAPFGAVAIAAALGAGPSTASGGGEVMRALTWASYDARSDAWVRQVNPLSLGSNGLVAVVTWVIWSALLVAMSVTVIRSMKPLWGWRFGVCLAVGATIIGGLPQRVSSDWFLLNRSFSDLLIGLPVILSGAAAAWMVWAELVVPRLVRPTTLVLQLDPHSTPEATRRRLARVIGDPSVQVVFAHPDGWIDGSGAQRPTVDASRYRVRIERDGVPVAAFDLDAAVPVEPDVLRQAAASLLVTLDAQRLAAAASADAIAARRATAHLLRVDDDAASDVAQRIASGPGQTLTDIDRRLTERPLPIRAIHDMFRQALDEVRSIAHGYARFGLSGDHDDFHEVRER
jgi:hypothetical protein